MRDDAGHGCFCMQCYALSCRLAAESLILSFTAQGFPDYFALVGLASEGKSWVRNKSLVDR